MQSGNSLEGKGASVDLINKENVIEESATSTYTFKKTTGTPNTIQIQNSNYSQATANGAQSKKKSWTPQEVRSTHSHSVGYKADGSCGEVRGPAMEQG
jgi:hypothetical protein